LRIIRIYTSRFAVERDAKAHLSGKSPNLLRLPSRQVHGWYNLPNVIKRGQKRPPCPMWHFTGNALNARRDFSTRFSPGYENTSRSSPMDLPTFKRSHRTPHTRLFYFGGTKLLAPALNDCL
jgi:hypothetical protein